jgi:solute carrier family 9 (sodium/hydrogen exchanger), member 8
MAAAPSPEAAPVGMRRSGLDGVFGSLPDLSGYLDGRAEPAPGLPRSAEAARSTATVGFLLLLVFSLSFALWTSRGLSGAVQDCPDCNCGATVADALPRSEHGAEALLGLGLSVFSATLACCILASYALMQWRFSFMPDCIAYVLLGALVGTVIRMFGSSSTLSISLPNEEQFFIFILPPIMFEAGYSLSKQDFFKEAGSIAMFAIPGTMISAIVFGIGIYCTGILGASYTFGFWEAMTFGALLSAVDPVATIAVFSALKVNKPLHFLVFGESVLNDAVAIVLYRTFSKLIGSESARLGLIVADFVRIFFGSALVGAASAVCASLVLKHTNLYRTPSLEMSFFLIMAYFPYFLCDGLHMSGIMGILVNGVVLAHYAHHNLSKVTQISAQQSFRTLAFLAETFVFVFLGSALTTFDHSWHGLTIMWGIILTLFSRFANIYPLAHLVNQWREHKISNKNQLIIWFSGLRGAVAFALSLNFPSSNGSDETRRAVISTTLAIVLFTVIVLGGGIMPLLRLLRVESAEDEAAAAAASANTDGSNVDLGRSQSGSRHSSGSGNSALASGSLSLKLQRLDDEVLKPWLLASSLRSMAATNRTLQTLAVVENDHLTPHQLGQVLEDTAAAELPEPAVEDTFQRVVVDAGAAGVVFDGYQDDSYGANEGAAPDGENIGEALLDDEERRRP